MRNTTESFKCLNLNCNYEWMGVSGPTMCRKCKSIYVQWVSWEKNWFFDVEKNEWKYKCHVESA